MLRLNSLALVAAFFVFGAQSAPALPQDPAIESVPISESTDGAEAIPALIPTESFAGRSIFWNIELSPDGKAISFLRRTDEGIQMVVSDPDTGVAIKALNFPEGSGVDWYEWVGPDKMLISLSTVVSYGGWWVRLSRLVLAYPKQGDYRFMVENQRGFNGGRVIHISDDGDSALIAHRGDGRLVNPSVFRYELEFDGEVSKVVEPKNDIWTWVADDDGVVRLGLGWKRRRLHIYYRENATADFERIARLRSGDEDGFFDAIQIISDSSRGYVLDEDETGKVGVRIFDYATREIVETFYEHPEWDIERFWIEDGKPIAAFYTDDSRKAVWFKEEDKKVYDELQALIGDRQIWVTSRSDDANRLLVSARNEADPGVLYLFDREQGQLRELLQFRPEIDFELLARPKPFTYTARDGTDIRAYLTLPKGREPANLPLVILPHGGPFGIRDSLVYNDEVQFLANRGYAVIQPNFRGSGGYGTDFYDLGVGEVGRGMQDDLDDAMDWAVAEGIADPTRVCVVGGSYGGYAALWAVLRNPERYRCAASWAGVTDWDKILRYDRRYLTRKAGKRWSAKIEGDDEEFDLKDVSPYRLAKNLNRPVLLAHGTEDDNVPFKQYELMFKALRKAPVEPVTLVVEGEGHSFSMKESEQKWYDALDSFLAEHNPADQLDESGELRLPRAEPVLAD